MVSFNVSFVMQRAHKLVPQTDKSGPFHRWPLFGGGPPTPRNVFSIANLSSDGNLRTVFCFFYVNFVDVVPSTKDQFCLIEFMDFCTGRRKLQRNY